MDAATVRRQIRIVGYIGVLLAYASIAVVVVGVSGTVASRAAWIIVGLLGLIVGTALRCTTLALDGLADRILGSEASGVRSD